MHQQTQAAERKTKHCKGKVEVFPYQCQNINKGQNPVENKVKWFHMHKVMLKIIVCECVGTHMYIIINVFFIINYLSLILSVSALTKDL